MAFEDPFFVEQYERHDGTRTEDIAFYIEQARLTSGPILDLGCGSGRLLLPLSEGGRAVVGVDSSDTMLDRLRERSPHLRDILVQCRFEDLDVHSLRQIHDGYGLIICAFNSFLHLMDQEAQLSFLGKIRELLLPSGRFVLDCVNPASHEMFSVSETERELEQVYHDQSSGEQVESWLTIKHDMIEQTGSLIRDYTITSLSGGITQHHSIVRYRWTYPSEMRLLLRAAGFKRLLSFGDYAFGALLDTSDNQVWIAS